MLYEAVNVILTHAVRGSDLKTWALALARRAGMRKSKVALARKLAVVLHRMLRDQTVFVAHRARPWPHSQEDETSFGRGLTITLPEHVPLPGRRIPSGRNVRSSAHR